MIAPPAIFSNKQYSAFLTTSYFEEDIDIVVKFRTEEGFFKIRRDQVTQLNNIVTFEQAGVKPKGKDKLHKYENKLSGYPLKILARQGGKCVSKEIVIVNTPRENHVFIQLDKPIYKPGDEVKVRVIVFDHDTKPIGINSIELEVRDSERNLVDRRTDLSGQNYNYLGFFEDIIPLGDYINLGLWNFTVKVNQNPNMVANKQVQVDKSKLPFYQVILNTKETVFLSERTFKVEFYGKYAFGEYAKGTAMLNITNAKTGIEMYSKNFQKIEAITTKSIDIANDLNIYTIPKGELDVNVTVKFLDSASSKKEAVTKFVTIKAVKKYSLEIIKAYPFQEGFDYNFDVVVKDPEGNILSFTSDPVEMSYQMQLSTGNSIDGTSHVPVENNVASFNIKAINGVKEIKIIVKYLKSKIEETIKPDLALTQAFRVTVSEKM